VKFRRAVLKKIAMPIFGLWWWVVFGLIKSKFRHQLWIKKIIGIKRKIHQEKMINSSRENDQFVKRK